jgi:hypothetical protein
VPYHGDEAFLAGATPRTQGPWAKLQALFVGERRLHRRRAGSRSGEQPERVAEPDIHRPDEQQAREPGQHRSHAERESLDVDLAHEVAGRDRE